MEIIPLLLLWLGVCDTSPPIALDDLRMFPPREQVRAQWRLAQWHRDWVREQAILSGGEYTEYRRQWDAAVAEAERLYAIWDTLDDACAWPEHECGRDKLADLRDLIGHAAYYQGAMPPPVPLWRGR